MPCLVRENLFIGNIGDAVEVLQNGSAGITHVLSVLSSASVSFFSQWRSSVVIPSKVIKEVHVGSEGEEGEGGLGGEGSRRSCLMKGKLLYLLEYAGKDLKFVRMAVMVRDTESENLLDYLDVCLDFIDRSRKEGGVLVHCFAGVSRSAAIVMAYLMRTERLSQEDALRSLRESCDSVCPNDGFLDQLKMFEEMGFKVDHASPIYKHFRLKVLGDAYHHGEKIDSSKFGDDPGLPAEVSSEIKSSTDAARKCVAYRCKNCRRVVALHDNIVGHMPGQRETYSEWDNWKNSSFLTKSDESRCLAIFVEPLKWMTTVEEGAPEGKLNCAHCKARLGSFNWSGIQCSCGSWVTPAFKLDKSRVDVSTV